METTTTIALFIIAAIVAFILTPSRVGEALQHKVVKQTSDSGPSETQEEPYAEALTALCTLGFSKTEAKRFLNQALEEKGTDDISTEEMVALALRMSKRSA